MTKLRLNPIACDGHGLCAELLPELISLDDWGYPVIHTGVVGGGEPGVVPPHLEDHARRAKDLCPKLALMLSRAG